ncbi:transglycosylase SLT domain-containing protein [Pseudoprimorskyibacter insulae]|uniref:transglycosylase SLT domain-containing protein n=1 Tax=Pseudoprimorskyibacter insulae TaxID=1695997 RepID=UPI001FEC695B|nr:transglycosylase SLT domain-containing protein [Pseudoprimorskyibacter insulae]
MAPAVSPRPQARITTEVRPARWDHVPGSTAWSRAALKALRSHASNLPDIVPRDIETWCPAYKHAPRPEREAFWVGLLSTLSKHESTWRPNAVGGGGLWYGLLQILPSTAEYRKCRATTPSQLMNGPANLACGLRIMSVTVARDQVVSAGFRGVAADWGPFHSQRKREDMMRWMRRQDYCAGLYTSPRPVARPVIDPLVWQARHRPEALLPPRPLYATRPVARRITP